MSDYKTFLVWTGALLLAALFYGSTLGNAGSPEGPASEGGQRLFQKGVDQFAWQTSGGSSKKKFEQAMKAKDKEIETKKQEIQALRAQLQEKDMEMAQLRNQVNEVLQSMKLMQAKVEEMAAQFQKQLAAVKEAQKVPPPKPEDNPILKALLEQKQDNAGEREKITEEIAKMQRSLYSLSDGKLGTPPDQENDPETKKRESSGPTKSTTRATTAQKPSAASGTSSVTTKPTVHRHHQ